MSVICMRRRNVENIWTERCSTGKGKKSLRLPMRLDAADFADSERRKSILKDMLGGMGEHVHIDIDFRCEYGKNGVTSAGSVVTRSVPADCVAVGNPCRVIKKL